MPKISEQKINPIPRAPGVYKFLDPQGAILYVGKAGNLRSRVKSYFNNTQELSLAKQDMAARIADIKYEKTNTENEALILESMLIKKHKPAYNVVFKDDKDYSFIKIDFDLKYPTVKTVKKSEIDLERKNQKIFGPFTSAYALRENLRLLRRIFPFKKKEKPLTRFEKDLLEKRALGPVPKNEKEYLEMIKRLIKIINGQTSSVKKELNKKMRDLSKQNKYEQAAKTRDQLKWLDIFSQQKKIISAKQYLEYPSSNSDNAAKELEELKKALGLEKIPKRIEGYDISNIKGQWSAGSMVVFTDGKPDKKEYRKFKIKTVKGADDFASLAEILRRRLNHDEWKTPDVVLLDGGKGQLSSVLRELFGEKKSLHGALELDCSRFISISKKQEEIHQGKTLKKVNLGPKSPACRLLQRVRDESHRFAQKYYHALHSKSSINK